MSKRLVAALCGLVALVALPLVPSAGAADVASVQEQATGVAFPVTRSVPGASDLVLTGTGVRTKLMFKVYAFALYVDPAVAKKQLSRWASAPADSLGEDTALHAALARLPGDRLAVMHFVRSVDAEKMKEAMTDAMDRHVKPGDPVRLAFLGLFRDEIKSGEDVALHIDGQGKVTLLRDWKVVGSVTSEPLAIGLMESWVGPEPVSNSIMTGVVTRLPEILR